MNVLVVGATGETGRRVVQELVRRQIAVRALVRNREQATSLLPPQAEIVVGDVLKPDSLAAALDGITAVICATGARPSLDPTGPYQVDYEGTKNLAIAAQQHNIEHLVLVSSLCVSRFFHPLNLFWLVLWWKKQAEEFLQRSGLTYTIVRPGGLKNEDSEASIIMEKADTLFEGSIPRTKVAQVCVEALFQPAARNQIVEIVARLEEPSKPLADLFESVA
jgi:uncharacterized protein YbjT (DUF2867 family)